MQTHSTKHAKNPHAVALGRLGGRSGKGEAKARTSKQARKAALARWAKYRLNAGDVPRAVPGPMPKESTL